MCVYAQNTDTDLYYQGFTYKDTRCIVTGNAVNVRSGAGSGYAKLFQLNAGDAVRIIEWSKDWEWLLEESYYAPWYKISCAQGTGYICGRYISCKEAVGDLDNDGEDEIFACLCITERKGGAVSDVHPSFYNVNKFHQAL